MRSEFFQLRFEYRVLLVGDGFLVENENIGDIIVMSLEYVSQEY